MQREDVDVVVIGTGFAGTLSALILHRLGLRPLLIDRGGHPRFAIGESSTPVANILLQGLCDRYDLPRLRPLSRYGTWQEAYPHVIAGRKRGFSYFHHRPGRPFIPSPDHAGELLVAASRDPYDCDTHWLRADVDAFLVAEARGEGIPVWEHTLLTEIVPGTRWRLRGTCEGEAAVCEAAFVLDGSGAGGVLAQAMRLERTGTGFRTCSRALYGHFEGVRPWGAWLEAQGGRLSDHPFPCDEAAVHQVLDGAWLWMLRFRNDRVSAGLVMDGNRYPQPAGMSPQAEWDRWLAHYPSVQALFEGSTLVDPPGGIVRTGRLQRRVRKAAGRNWALLPHTAGFIDPLHSTGIAHALCGIVRLVRIVERHRGRRSLGPALQHYARMLREEQAWVDELVAIYYAAIRDFRLFTAATMFYFAAVIAYERALLDRGPALLDRQPFLCADEIPLREAVCQGVKMLNKGVSAADFETHVDRAIAPYNTAGLLHPDVPNMYPHTAPPAG